jgi:hypothetical protein
LENWKTVEKAGNRLKTTLFKTLKTPKLEGLEDFWKEIGK